MAEIKKDICPLHDLVQTEVNRLRTNQEGRKCVDHESRLLTLERSDVRQWDDIKDLQRTVWKGVGILTAAGFGGSVIGTVVIALIKRFL